jgi:pyruvate kinase
MVSSRRKPLSPSIYIVTILHLILSYAFHDLLGTDAVMLSGETANGPYFQEAINVMARTCCEAEGSRNYNSLYMAIRASTMTRFNQLSSMESLASSAVKTAIDVNAALIVVLSQSGRTARYIAKYRPGRTIVCLTSDPTVARQVSGVIMGVHAFTLLEMTDDPELTQEIGSEAVSTGIAKRGDLMVIVSGTLHGGGRNNQVRVESISLEKEQSTMKRLVSFSASDEGSVE